MERANTLAARMCGRYSLFDPEEMYDRFSIIDDKLVIEIEPHYNIAPSRLLPVVLKRSPNHVTLMTWGIVPPWARNATRTSHLSGQIINARSETLFEKPMFKRLAQNRCLVPANGFFEWKKTDQGKMPYFIHLKHEALFAFAGVYDVWTDGNGKEQQAFVIITTQPNTLMQPIHNRMPVILHKEHEEEWLNPDVAEPERLLSLLQPYPVDEMEAYQVSTAVNNARLDTPALIKPIG